MLMIPRPSDGYSPTPKGSMNTTEVITAGVTTAVGEVLEILTRSQAYRHFEEAVYFALRVMVYQAVNQGFNLGFPKCLRHYFPGGVVMRVESVDPIYGA